MGEAGEQLLDNSDWVIESTGIVPGAAGLLVRALTFSLVDSELERARELAVGPRELDDEALDRFLRDLADIHLEPVVSRRYNTDDWRDGSNPLRSLLSGLPQFGPPEIDPEVLADLLEEVRLPVFASRATRNEKIKQIGQQVQGMVGVVGGIGTGLGGHVGSVLVIISTIGVSVVWVGTWAAIGASNGWDWIKRRRLKKRAEKARRDEDLRRREEEAKRAREAQAAKAEQARLAAKLKEKRGRMKAKAPKFKIESGDPKGPKP